jgi:hypothetical protein
VVGKIFAQHGRKWDRKDKILEKRTAKYWTENS